jgi:hypothetical protein
MPLRPRRESYGEEPALTMSRALPLETGGKALGSLDDAQS